MERLKRSFSFRKKKDHVPECSKPHQWQEDERKVREGTCSFQVRYLGCIEVFESRGIQVCEEAVKALKSQCKGKYQRAILYVSGDALRVVDEISKGLIVDQTIEKVSFCAPDRSHEKGFAYICRDGTTRRWMCHGFLALKESGERLSHAVGCAFAICLEKKQKREKDTVEVTFNEKGTSFTRTGSFRHTTLTERLADPQSAIIADPVPEMGGMDTSPASVQRPHASDAMLQRQASFRGFFPKLSESSPFKRQLSLRVNELPSTLERQRQLGHQNSLPLSNGPVSPIPEASPTKEEQESISSVCQQLTQGLSAMASEDPFVGTTNGGPHSTSQAGITHSTVPPPAAHNVNSAMTVSGHYRNIPTGAAPIKQENPWMAGAQTSTKVSDADFWLHSTASSIAAGTTTVNGTAHAKNDPFVANPAGSAAANRAPHLSHLRSHSVDTAEMPSAWPPQQHRPTLRELTQRGHVVQFQSQQNGTVTSSGPWSSRSAASTAQQSVDPFEAAWSAKTASVNKTNPFQTADSVTKTFEVKL